MDRKSRDVHADEIRGAEYDPQKEVDVLAIHRQAFRETGDPIEGAESGPWWFWACAVLAIAFGGFYMGRYTGLFVGESAVHAPVGPAQMMAAASGEKTGAAPANGATIFAGTCAACHQATGLGAPGMFPPLAGSEFVTGDPGRLARLVLHGLTGPVTVKGSAFNGQMPPWQQLSDAEVAAVLSYVRSSWGNGAPAVAPDVVQKERAATATRTAPWTEAELGP